MTLAPTRATALASALSDYRGWHLLPGSHQGVSCL
jgi:hypothetical protein